MVGLGGLWLPILLSAVFVFIASSIIHMGPFWHRTDYPKIPKEDEVMNALRPLGIPPGDYMVPRAASSKEMQTPEFMKKLNEGPVLMVTVMPNGMIGMARSLVLWFVYLLIVGLFAAYVAGRTLPAGTEYLHVFQVAGATAFAGYALAMLQMSIWYRRQWSATLKAAFDGLIYALLTGGTFGWLWPAAASG